MKRQRQLFSTKLKFQLKWVHVKQGVWALPRKARTILVFKVNTYAHRTISTKFREVSLEKLQNSFRLQHENAIRKY